jgi:hypothetical protein
LQCLLPCAEYSLSAEYSVAFSCRIFVFGRNKKIRFRSITSRRRRRRVIQLSYFRIFHAFPASASNRVARLNYRFLECIGLKNSLLVFLKEVKGIWCAPTQTPVEGKYINIFEPCPLMFFGCAAAARNSGGKSCCLPLPSFLPFSVSQSRSFRATRAGEQ